MFVRSCVCLAVVALFAIPALPLRAAEDVAPLPNAHAHNDYEHPRPLLDALDHGFCSVEADIYLVDGKLLVAHNRQDLKPERTIEALYLDPLRERVRRNGGKVYRDGPWFMLLIDFKSEAEPTYAVLRETLARYSEMLTECRDGNETRRAVTAVLSGSRPDKTVADEKVRYCGLDGRLDDMASNPPVSLVPLFSENWRAVFKWRGIGPIPDDERAKLRGLVSKAHFEKRTVRFYGTIDKPEVWDVLLAAGVDWINADNLDLLQKYLLARPTAGRP